MDQFKGEMDQYELDMLGYSTDLADWKKAGRKNGQDAPAPPEKPVCHRLWCSDVTVEALAARLDIRHAVHLLIKVRKPVEGDGGP